MTPEERAAYDRGVADTLAVLHAVFCEFASLPEDVVIDPDWLAAVRQWKALVEALGKAQADKTYAEAELRAT